MSKETKLSGFISALLFVTAPVTLHAVETFDTLFFDTPAMAFSHDDLSTRSLPARIHALNFPLVFSHQLEISCMGKRPGRDDVMVYVPDTKACGSLNDILDAGNHGSRASFAQERPRLLAQLESSRLVIIQPQPELEPYPPFCGGCQKPDDPALIWSDGFEGSR